MRIEDVKIGQLVGFPSEEWSTRGPLGWDGHGDLIAHDEDIGIVIEVLPSSRQSEEVAVLWSSDGKILRVESEALDLLAEVI